MTTVVNRASPTFGMALGYFLVLYGVLNNYIPAEYQAEAVAMAGVVVTNVLMEVKGLGQWIASLFSKNKEEDKPEEQ